MGVPVPQFIKGVLGFIFSQGHLASYKHIIFEQRTQKIIRLFEDKTFISENSQIQENNRIKLILTKILQHIYNFAYRQNKCISPCTKKMLIWYFFVFVSSLYFFIEVGMLLAFGSDVEIYLQNTPGYLTASAIFLLVLYVDIVMQFITGYIYQGVLVRQPQKVVAHYLRYLFWCDLAFVIIQSIAMNTTSFQISYFKLFIFLKFIRLLQIDKFYLRRLSLNKVLKVAYVIFKQMVIIFVTSQIIGVAFYTIDFYFVNTPICQGGNQQFCWLYNATAYSPIIELSYSLQYFYIIYYGISTITTISYGDIQSKNPWQQTYQIPIMLFSFIIYAYIVNNIVSIIIWVRKQSDEYKAEMLLIDLYMKELQIKHKLKSEIHFYLEFLYIEQLHRNKEMEKQLIDKLPQDLQSQLLQGLYSEIYSQLVYMFPLNDQVKSLLPHIEQSIYTENEQIQAQNEILTKLLYIERGQVKLECEYNKHYFQLTTICFGNFVATNHFIKQDKLPFSIIAQKSANVYSLEHKYLRETCEDFSFKQVLKSLEYEIKVGRNYSKLSQRCFYCEQNHLWNDCPQKFPCFKNFQLASNKEVKLQRQKAKQRGLRHNVLVCKKQLKVLQVFAKIGDDYFFNKIQSRLKKIRQRIQISRQLFELDAAYDWQLYCPEENLSKLRFEWQSKKIQNNIIRKTIFRNSRQISF